MENFKPLILIPTYNEAENIKLLIQEIFKYCPDINLLIIDDNSPDKTADAVESLSDTRIHILKREKKSGLAKAYLDGFRYGAEHNYNVFIEMDADFSHSPEYLPTMLENLKNYDFVIGSRNIKGGYVKNWSFLRSLISKFGSIYSGTILQCPVRDLTGGFNGWHKEVLDTIGLKNIISKGYSFQIELKYRAYKKGFKFTEFPIIFQDRKFGDSKMNKSIFFEAMINVLKFRFTK